MYKYLEKEEDICFSRLIRKVNNIKDEKEKEDRRKDLYERTSLLIYWIAKEKMFLTDDETIEIYLICQNELDRIISSFTIAEASFNSYLQQVIRFRLRRIRKIRALDNLYEYEYKSEELKGEPFLSDSALLEYEEEEKEKSITIGNFDNLTITETIEYIVNNGDRKDLKGKTVEESLLSKELENRKNRENLLFLFLIIPGESAIIRTENFSRIFHTDEGAFLHLLDLRDKMEEDQNERKERYLSIAAKHWRLMCSIKIQLENCENPLEKRMLNENYQTQARLHRRNIDDALKVKHGIKMSVLARKIGCSSTKISYGIKNIKEVLENVIKESNMLKEGENTKEFPSKYKNPE